MTNTSTNTNTKNFNYVELGKSLEQAREALVRFSDYDDGGPIYTKDRMMIDRRRNQAIAAIVEYNGPSKPPNSIVGYIVAYKKAAPLFTGVHLLVEDIPIDGKWGAVHKRNIATFMKLMPMIYEQDIDCESRAQQMQAVRRQLLMYKVVFPDAPVDVRPCDEEKLLLVDARLSHESGNHIKALSEYLRKFETVEE